jgi:hypothetical protein
MSTVCFAAIKVTHSTILIVELCEYCDHYLLDLAPLSTVRFVDDPKELVTTINAISEGF